MCDASIPDYIFLTQGYQQLQVKEKTEGTFQYR